MHSRKRQLKRLTSRVARSGFGKLLHEFNVLHHLPFRDFRRRERFAESAADGRALVRTLEELGPGFVEAGSIIASRSDIIPLHYQNALLNNTAALPVMDVKKFTKLLRQSIGRSGMETIANIAAEPYRSNLVSETRKAILKNGKRALVTVNDPDAVRLLGQNAATITELLPAIKSRFASVIFDNMIEELKRRAEMLSDLSVVASRAEMLDAHFERHAKVQVPEVLWEYTSKDILVQRWHNHPSMREIASGRKTTAAARKYINRYLAEAFIYQYGIGGVFVLRPLLSDMQVAPGNTIIINHTLGTGYLEPEERRAFVAMLYALLEGESERAAKVLLKAHYKSVGSRAYFSSGIQVPEPRTASVSELLWELLERAWHGNLHVPLSFSMAAESVLYLEHAFKRFDPEASLNDNLLLAIKKYAPEAFGLSEKNVSAAEAVASVIRGS